MITLSWTFRSSPRTHRRCHHPATTKRRQEFARPDHLRTDGGRRGGIRHREHPVNAGKAPLKHHPGNCGKSRSRYHRRRGCGKFENVTTIVPVRPRAHFAILLVAREKQGGPPRGILAAPFRPTHSGRSDDVGSGVGGVADAPLPQAPPTSGVAGVHDGDSRHGDRSGDLLDTAAGHGSDGGGKPGSRRPRHGSAARGRRQGGRVAGRREPRAAVAACDAATAAMDVVAEHPSHHGVGVRRVVWHRADAVRRRHRAGRLRRRRPGEHGGRDGGRHGRTVDSRRGAGPFSRRGGRAGCV